jgi:hypothetical protein
MGKVPGLIIRLFGWDDLQIFAAKKNSSMKAFFIILQARAVTY